MKVPDLLKLTKKKIIIFAALIIVLFLGYNYTKPKPVTVEFATVKRQDVKSTVFASGTLEGKNSANLHFKASGKLAFINVKTGSKVSQGEVIAGLDTQDLAIALQQAKNTLRDKQAAVDKTLDDIHLFQYGNGGFSNVGTGNETMSQLQLRTAAQVARDSAVDSVKASERVFQDAVIISPIDGTITQVMDVAGQIVFPSDIIARVVDTSAIYFDAEVDEADISGVSVGQDAEVTLNTYPDKTFKGSVQEILPDTKTTSSNATVIIVRILVNDSNIKSIPGLNGQATIIVNTAKNVLSIPTESIKADNTVMVKDAKGLTRVPVTLGIRSDTDTEVKSGLSEGQQIVLNPT